MLENYGWLFCITFVNIFWPRALFTADPEHLEQETILGFNVETLKRVAILNADLSH